jgi:CDP-glycerol glycerophosphotransferase
MSFFQDLFSISRCNFNHKKINIFGLRLKYKFQPDELKYYLSLPIQNNKIIFRNHTGSYSDNVKYVTEELLRQNLPYDIVWIVNKKILKCMKNYPKNVRLVMNHTKDAYKEYLTARVWVDVDRRAAYVKKGINKRDGQIYIQCFHGAFGIKKCGSDRKDRTNSSFWKDYKIDASQIDYCISNSTQATNFFRSSFWGYGKILEFGQPRNDIFFKDNKAAVENVYKELKIPSNKKIIFYAPTYRENKDLKCFALDFEKVIKAASEKFGNEYVVMLRLHPFVADLKDQYIKDFDNIIDATDYTDMQELLAASDILITDYSSSIYDFMLQYKPAFIFATDRKIYEKRRGLYYSLSETPFPIAENNDEILANIKAFDYEDFKTKVKAFMESKGCVDDGHASERVVDLIKAEIDKANSEKDFV